MKIYNDLLPIDDLEAEPVIAREEVSNIGTFPDVDAIRKNGIPEDWVDPSLLIELDSFRRRSREIAARAGSFSKWTGLGAAFGPSVAENRIPLLFGIHFFGDSRLVPFFDIRLAGPGPREGTVIDVEGTALLGVPALISGNTESLCWSITPAGGAVDRLYILRTDEALPTRYVFAGAWFDMTRVDSPIRVWSEGGAREMDNSVYRALHGPILKFSGNAPLAAAYRSSWWRFEPAASILEPLMKLLLARNYDDFRESVIHLRPSLHVLYADARSTAYIWAGRYPTYGREHDPRIPILGSGKHEWIGFFEFDLQPQKRNSSRGYFIAGTNKPELRWPGLGGRVYEGNSIQSMMDAGISVSAENLTSLSEILERRRPPIEVWLFPYLAEAARSDAVSADPAAAELVKFFLQSETLQLDSPKLRHDYRLLVNDLQRRVFEREFPILFEVFGEAEREEILGNYLARLFDSQARRPARQEILNGKSPEALLIESILNVAREFELLAEPTEAAAPVEQSYARLFVAGRPIRRIKLD